jgi:hypothetical protein
MRIVEPPSLDSPWRGPAGDDLDGLLSAFFRSEMPRSWSAPELPDEQPRTLPLPSPRRRSILRSRLALAASIALLLAGAWFLSGEFASITGPGSFDSRKDEASSHGTDLPRKTMKEDGLGLTPRSRERIIVDPSGRTGFQIEFEDR